MSKQLDEEKMVEGFLSPKTEPKKITTEKPQEYKPRTKSQMLQAIRNLERKSEKLAVLLRPTDKEKLKEIAEANEVSVNEMIGILINEYKIKIKKR